MDAISASKDGIDNPFSAQNAKAAGAEVTIALSSFDWVLMRTYSDRERNHQSGGSKARTDPIKGGDG
ncbi:MAG TPA: hypothetical protein VGU20_11035 [Stellaceae bacterium]|nr:hypothetical protein [Stellaceae bacterium]